MIYYMLTTYYTMKLKFKKKKKILKQVFNKYAQKNKILKLLRICPQQLKNLSLVDASVQFLVLPRLTINDFL